MDRASLSPAVDGWRIAGTSLGLEQGRSHEIRYSLLTDGSWRTLTVGAHVQSAVTDRGLALRADGRGAWTVGDEPVIDLYGAIDAALSWSPASHTLALRRLELDIGEAAETAVALVTYPQRSVERVTYRYERLDETAYRWTGSGFDLGLTTDGQGIVTAVAGRWEAVATNPATTER